jgi:hypothetical protein
MSSLLFNGSLEIKVPARKQSTTQRILVIFLRNMVFHDVHARETGPDLFEGLRKNQLNLPGVDCDY